MIEITAEIRAFIDKAAAGVELAEDEYIDPSEMCIRDRDRTVCKFRRGVGRQHDLRMDNAAFPGVVCLLYTSQFQRIGFLQCMIVACHI